MKSGQLAMPGSLEDYAEVVESKVQRFEEEKKFAVEEEEFDPNDRVKQQSKRAYIKALKEVIEQADVVCEVLDARDPMSCRNIEMEHQIVSAGKKLVLILNKIDLISAENARAWLARLRDEHPTVLFKATTQQQASNLGARSSLHKSSMTDKSDLVESMLSSSKSVGSEDLLQTLKNYCRTESDRKIKR